MNMYIRNPSNLAMNNTIKNIPAGIRWRRGGRSKARTGRARGKRLFGWKRRDDRQRQSEYATRPSVVLGGRSRSSVQNVSRTAACTMPYLRFPQVQLLPVPALRWTRRRKMSVPNLGAWHLASCHLRGFQAEELGDRFPTKQKRVV